MNSEGVADLIMLFNWNFVAMAKILDPVLSVDPLILQNMAYKIQSEGEERAIKARL